MSRLGSLLLVAFVCVFSVVSATAQTPGRRGPQQPDEARATARRVASARRNAASGAAEPRARGTRRAARQSPATARVTLTRLPSNPYHARVEVSVEGPDVWEFAADHRILSFEVTPVPEAPVEGARPPRGRARARRVRPLTCKHPNAGRRTDSAHILRTPAQWSEPIDLRMYCMGRAYDAIVAGATIVPVYGFRRASAKAYLARSVTDPSLLPLASVRGEAFVPFPRETPTTPAAPVEATNTTDTSGPGVEIGLIPTDSTAPNAPVLRAFVRGTRSVRIYMRDDLYTFTITDPSGRTSTCSAPRTVVVPIIDFFKRVSRTSRIETSTDTARHCQGIFEEPGIYEVVPGLELPYGGERFHIDAVTGRFTGPRSFVRVRPQRGAYVVPRT